MTLKQKILRAREFDVFYDGELENASKCCEQCKHTFMNCETNMKRAWVAARDEKLFELLADLADADETLLNNALAKLTNLPSQLDMSFNARRALENYLEEKEAE